MAKQYGRKTSGYALEATAAPQKLPDYIMDDLTIFQLDFTNNGPGTILSAIGGIVPASGEAVDEATNPCIKDFTTKPPRIGTPSADGDTMTLLRLDFESFLFCLADADQPASFTVYARKNAN